MVMRPGLSVVTEAGLAGSAVLGLGLVIVVVLEPGVVVGLVVEVVLTLFTLLVLVMLVVLVVRVAALVLGPALARELLLVPGSAGRLVLGARFES